MVDNALAAIPAPVAYLGAAANAVADMTAFPDSTSSATFPVATPGKVKDSLGVNYAFGVGQDKTGYLLYTHDRAANSLPAPFVNYINMDRTKYYYTVETDGTVRQWKDADTSVAASEYKY